MLGHSIGKTDNYLIDKIKIIVPNEIKQFLKDTLFFSQNQKILEQQFVEKIEEQDFVEKIEEQDKELAELEDRYGKLAIKDKRSAAKYKELLRKDEKLVDQNKRLAELRDRYRKLKGKYEQLTIQDKQSAEPVEKPTDIDKLLTNRDKLILENDFELVESYVRILPFKENFKFEKNESKKIDNTNFKLQAFTNPILNAIAPTFLIRAYLESYNGNLFLITGTGELMYTSIKNIKNENFILNKIQTNFRDIAGSDYIQKQKRVVTDLLIKKNKLYVSYIKSRPANDVVVCDEMAILVSNLDLNEMVFKEFFNNNQCMSGILGAEGGRLSDFIGNKILMTIGDGSSYEGHRRNDPQKTESFLGKIISIDEDTKEYELLSMGHRHPQGLFYDKESNIIFSTEHGPEGGDEINVNISPDDGKIKNYGWAISSYGEHYPEYEERINYELAPLHKSHKDYGFIEPLKEFTPAIGIAPIIETNEFIHMPNKKVLYVGSMGWEIEEGDRSIHQIILNPDLTIAEHNIMPIGERVRDIIYVKELNRILLFLESTGSIGILGIAN